MPAISNRRSRRRGRGRGASSHSLKYVRTEEQDENPVQAEIRQSFECERVHYTGQRSPSSARPAMHPSSPRPMGDVLCLVQRLFKLFLLLAAATIAYFIIGIVVLLVGLIYGSTVDDHLIGKSFIRA